MRRKPLFWICLAVIPLVCSPKPVLAEGEGGSGVKSCNMSGAGHSASGQQGSAPEQMPGMGSAMPGGAGGAQMPGMMQQMMMQRMGGQSSAPGEGAKPHAWLGVTVEDPKAGSPNAGVMVTHVIDKSPGAASGIKAGDVITSFNGQRVGNTNELAQMLSEAAIGSRAQVGLISNGQAGEVTVNMAEAPTAPEMSQPAGNMPYPGMFMKDMLSQTPLSQGGMQGGSQKGIPAGQKPPEDWNYLQLIQLNRVELGLTAEQGALLDDLLREQEKENIRRDAEIQVNRLELDEILAEEKTDLVKIGEKVKRLEAIRGERILSQAEAVKHLVETLNQEQRQKLRQIYLTRITP